MQASLLSTNTHFNAMPARTDLIKDIQVYPEYDRHNPSLPWSLPNPALTKKIPTESDDRDDYSSDSEKAEEELGSADFSGVSSCKPSDERDCECTSTTTGIIPTKPLLTSTVSFGEHVVLVAAQAANAEAQVSFQLQNVEDEDMKVIVEGLEKVSLTKRDSVPLTIGRGPNGGRATKTGTLSENQFHGTGCQRHEPIESWDSGYNEVQPKKFYKPNEETICNDNAVRCDHYSQPDVYGTAPLPKMQNQVQHSWYDPLTGYSFSFAEGPGQYFDTCQGIAPTYQPQPHPHSQPTWGLQYPPRIQSEICQNVQHLVQSSPTESNFRYGDIPTTLIQRPSPTIDSGDLPISFPVRPNNQPYYFAAQPSTRDAAQPSIPEHQLRFVCDMQTVPHVPLDEGTIRISEAPSGASPISTLSSGPVSTCFSSAADLELVLDWLGEQAEAPSQFHSLPVFIPPMTDHQPSSLPVQHQPLWNDSAPPSFNFNVVASSYSNYFPVASSGQSFPPCNSFTPTLARALPPDGHFDVTVYTSGTESTSLGYRIPSNSTGSLTTASSSSNLCPSPTSVLLGKSPPNVQFPSAVSPSSVRSSVSSSAVDASPSSRASGADAADVRRIHTSFSSDCLTANASVLSLSDIGSVSNSPSSVFESDAAIPSGDEPRDDDQMVQVAEAEAVAESFQELALISPDSQGDTPLHVAMIDDKWYLAEAILKRLIRDNLLKHVINSRNKLQQTPLCLAVICNKPQVVETLIEYGADVNVNIKASDDYLGPKFCQPLHLAASRGHLWKQTLRKLLRADNINLDAFNSDGKSALHCAIEGHGRQFKDVTIDCKETMRMLAERGANLNQPDCGHEKTPLHYAVERRNVELVSRLLFLANSCSLNHEHSSVAQMLEARTGNGNTALHLAASVDMNTIEHKKLIQQLMSKGADPSSKNSDGFLPRELTKNRAIVELLKGRTASGRTPNTEKKRTS